MKRLLLLMLLVLEGCAGVPGKDRPFRPPQEIHQDTLWQGRILVEGTVKVFKGATLTILPGTEVAFVRRDLDHDGLGDSTLVVEGALHALGTRLKPILFHSAAVDPRPGDWLELRVDFSRDVHLRHCQIRDSAYTLHAHFTLGLVEDCTISNNIDGCRLGQATFVIRNSLIENNQGKGINFRNTSVEVVGNIIRNNGSGIFLFETDRPPSIHDNNIYGNRDNFRLGDFFTGEVHLAGNWWGTADAQAAAATIYDRKQDPTLGTVTLEPQGEWVGGCGPRDPLSGLSEVWSFSTGGFVDASPQGLPGGVVLASWDGRLRAVDTSGKILWTHDVGEVVDAAPLVADGRVYLQSWGREVRALDASDGRLLWSFVYGSSPADDHRQGGLARVADLLLVPAWNGTLYALDPTTGLVRWNRFIDLPLRSTPVSDGERIYQGSGSGRLAVVDLTGRLLWDRKGEAPLLASPLLYPAGILAVDKEGTVTARSREGDVLWKRSLSQPCFYGAPVWTGDALAVPTAGGTLWKLDPKTGGTLWALGGFGPIYGTPKVADGRIFIGDNDGRLHVVGADSGMRLATFAADGEIQGTPVLLDGLLIFGARDHRVRALGITEIE